jgi:hypothetical protein
MPKLIPNEGLSADKILFHHTQFLRAGFLIPFSASLQKQDKLNLQCRLLQKFEALRKNLLLPHISNFLWHLTESCRIHSTARNLPLNTLSAIIAGSAWSPEFLVVCEWQSLVDCQCH